MDWHRPLIPRRVDIGQNSSTHVPVHETHWLGSILIGHECSGLSDEASAPSRVEIGRRQEGSCPETRSAMASPMRITRQGEAEVRPSLPEARMKTTRSTVVSWSIELDKKLDAILIRLNASAEWAKKHRQACEQCQGNEKSSSKAGA